jgi:hypothetical protein
MTEAQIERRVARMIDELDARYLSTSMTADAYKARLKQIDQWAWMQAYSARLANAAKEG